MDFRLRRQSLLERAKQQEEKARREKNAQAQDIMRALAMLYREMAEELEEGSEIPNYMRDCAAQDAGSFSPLFPDGNVEEARSWR